MPNSARRSVRDETWGSVCSGDDPISLESWSSVKLGEADVVSVRPEIGGEKQGFCSHRADLIQSMESAVVYKWIPNNPAVPQYGTPVLSEPYYKHPMGMWLNAESLALLKQTTPRTYSLFQLEYVEPKLVGTQFGVSNIHGSIVDIYRLVPLASQKDYVELAKRGYIPSYRRTSYARTAREREEKKRVGREEKKRAEQQKEHKEREEKRVYLTLSMAPRVLGYSTWFLKLISATRERRVTFLKFISPREISVRYQDTYADNPFPLYGGNTSDPKVWKSVSGELCTLSGDPQSVHRGAEPPPLVRAVAPTVVVASPSEAYRQTLTLRASAYLPPNSEWYLIRHARETKVLFHHFEAPLTAHFTDASSGRPYVMTAASTAPQSTIWINTGNRTRYKIRGPPIPAHPPSSPRYDTFVVPPPASPRRRASLERFEAQMRAQLEEGSRQQAAAHQLLLENAAAAANEERKRQSLERRNALPNAVEAPRRLFDSSERGQRLQLSAERRRVAAVNEAARLAALERSRERKQVEEHKRRHQEQLFEAKQQAQLRREIQANVATATTTRRPLAFDRVRYRFAGLPPTILLKSGRAERTVRPFGFEEPDVLVVNDGAARYRYSPATKRWASIDGIDRDPRAWTLWLLPTAEANAAANAVAAARSGGRYKLIFRR